MWKNGKWTTTNNIFTDMQKTIIEDMLKHFTHRYIEVQTIVFTEMQKETSGVQKGSFIENKLKV